MFCKILASPSSPGPVSIGEVFGTHRTHTYMTRSFPYRDMSRNRVCARRPVSTWTLRLACALVNGRFKPTSLYPALRPVYLRTKNICNKLMCCQLFLWITPPELMSPINYAGRRCRWSIGRHPDFQSESFGRFQFYWRFSRVLDDHERGEIVMSRLLHQEYLGNSACSDAFHIRNNTTSSTDMPEDRAPGHPDVKSHKHDRCITTMPSTDTWRHRCLAFGRMTVWPGARGLAGNTYDNCNQSHVHVGWWSSKFCILGSETGKEPFALVAGQNSLLVQARSPLGSIQEVTNLQQWNRDTGIASRLVVCSSDKSCVIKVWNKQTRVPIFLWLV